MRPETLRAASTAVRDDAERIRLATVTAANALLAAVGASGEGPLGESLDRFRDDVTRALAAVAAEIVGDADRVVATASTYDAGDASASDAIGRVLSPDAASRS